MSRFYDWTEEELVQLRKEAAHLNHIHRLDKDLRDALFSASYCSVFAQRAVEGEDWFDTAIGVRKAIAIECALIREIADRIHPVSEVQK